LKKVNFSRTLLTVISLTILALCVCSLAAAQEQTGESRSGRTTAGALHFDLTSYLWFSGMHGLTSVGSHSASMHASIGELLSDFKFGLVGAAEVRSDRWLLNGDLTWMRLGDAKSVPISDVSTASADVRISEVIWTSKIGYRLFDGEYLKGDVNLGVRYWHLGQRFKLNPPGIDASAFQNWADFVTGGRVQLPLGMSEKVSVEAGGDVGGWGLAADLDYQFFAGLNYKTGKHGKLLAGYRYMLIDYRRNGGVYNVITAGPVLGATWNFR
jgi:hypothetical protein